MKSVLKYILAFVFISSALMKLIDLRNTINLYAAYFDLSYDFTRILLVVLIITEVTFAVLIVSELLKNKIVFYLITSALIVFTSVSIVLMVKGVDNCGCFGTLLPDKPIISIFKNLILLAVLFFLRKKTLEEHYA